MAQSWNPKEQDDGLRQLVIFALVIVILFFALTTVLTLLKITVFTIGALVSVGIQLLPIIVIAGLGYFVWKKFIVKKPFGDEIPQFVQKHFSEKDKKDQDSANDAEIKKD